MFANSTIYAAIMCELGQLLLPVLWHKMLVKFVGRLVHLPGERLVSKACAQAQQLCTPWFRQIWLVGCPQFSASYIRGHICIFIRCDHLTGHLVPWNLSIQFH